MTLSATDDVGVTGYCAKESSATPSATNSCWSSVTSETSYSADVSFTLSSISGTKTVYVWFRDSAGNVSTSASDSITLTVSDTTAPSSLSIKINNDDASTISIYVKLTLSATDNVVVTGYCAKESSTTPSNNDSCWVSVTSVTNYSSTVAFTLSSGSGTKTVYVCFKDAAGNISNVASDNIIYSPWAISTIDSVGDVGGNTSIVTDSNNKVHITYTDDTGVLKYATNVSGSWVISAIDNSVRGSTPVASIAVDSNNSIYICYLTKSARGLKYATNASGSWITSILIHDSNYNDILSSPSLSIDSNNKIHISYYNKEYKDIRYLTNASDSWITSIIDTSTTSSSLGGDRGTTSITIDPNNNVHICYLYLNLLKYATNTSGSWVISTIIDTPSYYSSLKVDKNGKAHISYSYGGDVKYANNTSGSWTNITIDSIDTGEDYYEGFYTSIAVDSSNNAHISYFDASYIYNVSGNFDLKYATNKSGSWVVSVIDDSSNSVGLYPSISVDSGDKVCISYYDWGYGGSTRDLKYATNQ